MKKGQIALYAVIAVFLVLSALIAVYVQNQSSKAKLAPSVISPEVKPIDTFVRSCIQSTGRDALVYVGQRGGYYILPKDSLGESYPHFFSGGRNTMPSIGTIENEISSYMDDMLYFCTKNFEDFPGAEADPDLVKTETKIMNDKVVFDVKWPITLTKTEVYNLNEFSAEIPSRLGIICKAAKNITDSQAKTFPSICLSCITKSMLDNNLEMDTEYYDEDNVIFTITDPDTLFNDEPYEFVFAGK